jgi:hypothetical protein
MKLDYKTLVLDFIQFLGPKRQKAIDFFLDNKLNDTKSEDDLFEGVEIGLYAFLRSKALPEPVQKKALSFFRDEIAKEADAFFKDYTGTTLAEHLGE